MKKLTPTQQEVLDFIRGYIADYGESPTRAEIAEHFGWKSHNAAQTHVYALKRKGHIDLVPANRNIKLL